MVLCIRSQVEFGPSTQTAPVTKKALRLLLTGVFAHCTAAMAGMVTVTAAGAAEAESAAGGGSMTEMKAGTEVEAGKGIEAGAGS